MSSTKNVKGNRKILLAQYEPCEGVFKIPDGIDLNDKSVVSEYVVNYDTMTINYVNGKKEKIKCDFETEAVNGCKPNLAYKTTIEDAADFDIKYTEDEGDCEECGKKVTDVCRDNFVRALIKKIDDKRTDYEADIIEFLELFHAKEWVCENFPELYK